MAYDGWMTFNGVEIANISRTVQLATALGVNTVKTPLSEVSWIGPALGETGYNDITEAPWYAVGYPASTEFAGIVPLSMSGMGDSSLERSGVEYVGDRGNSGLARNARQPIVASFVLVGSTERGVEYGKRWLDQVLRGKGGLCAGVDLEFFRSAGSNAEKVHYRDVKLTRGSTTARIRVGDCNASMTITFTLTADDPFIYGEPVNVVGGLGEPTGPTNPWLATSSGTIDLIEQMCPVYDYSPIFDPLHPALIPSPTAPNPYPASWDIYEGDSFRRFWARTGPIDPTTLDLAPLLKITNIDSARMVRISVWSASEPTTVFCDPLFNAVVTYMPGNSTLYIDAEQQASYFWDGLLNAVRRADSLVFRGDASPVRWDAFNSPDGLLIALDIFEEPGIPGVLRGNGTVRAELQLIPKSS